MKKSNFLHGFDAAIILMIGMMLLPCLVNAQAKGTFTDVRDGRVYAWVKIGTQTWMGENLKVTRYRDGSQISNFTSDNYNTGNRYRWFVVNDDRKICPVGWHVPSDVEWCQMETYLDASINCATTGWKGTNAGGKMKEVGTSHWANPNTGATNSSGFMCLPGGYRLPSGGFETLATGADFWTTSGSSSSTSWYRTLANNTALVYRNFGEKTYGFSGRCINDQ